MEKDYYKILGLSEEDKKLQGEDFKKLLKSNYRKIALQNHPDKQQGKSDAEKAAAETRFKDAAEAYEVLSDDTKRAQYDNPASNFKFEGFSGGMGMDDILNHFASSFGFNPFGDAFNFSMNEGVSNGPQKGANIRIRLGITLQDVLNGTKKTLKYERMERCSKCHGTGMDEHSHMETCPQCGGTGTKMFQQGMFQTITTCPHCHGKGKIITNPCQQCGGSGIEKKPHTIEFTVPKGAMDGMQFIMRGEGSQGAGENGLNGDLYIVLVELDDDKFVRTGNDIRFSLNVPIIDCLIGCETNVTTIDGKTLKTKIPECVEEGTEITFRGYGLPHYKNSNVRGNMIGVIGHIMPKKLTDEQKKILSDLKATIS